MLGNDVKPLAEPSATMSATCPEYDIIKTGASASNPISRFHLFYVLAAKPLPIALQRAPYFLGSPRLDNVLSVCTRAYQFFDL